RESDHSSDKEPAHAGMRANGPDQDSPSQRADVIGHKGTGRGHHQPVHLQSLQRPHKSLPTKYLAARGGVEPPAGNDQENQCPKPLPLVLHEIEARLPAACFRLLGLRKHATTSAPHQEAGAIRYDRLLWTDPSVPGFFRNLLPPLFLVNLTS